MLLYEKKLEGERHIYGTLGTVPSDEDERVLFYNNDSEVVEPSLDGKYYNDGKGGIIDENGNALNAAVDGEVVIPQGDAEDKPEPPSEDYEAEIEDEEFESFKDAMAAAVDGDIVKLLKNIEVSDSIKVDKNIILDMGGHSINYSTTVSKSEYKELFEIKAGGELTITGNGSIIGPEDGAKYDSKVLISVSGTLNYLNGTMISNGEGSDGMYGVYILDNGEAIFGTEDEGPSITAHFAAIGTNNTTAPANITVLNGSYKSLAAPADSDWWSYFCAPVYAAACGSYTLNGGNFEGYYGIVSSRYEKVVQNILIDDVNTNSVSGIDVFMDQVAGKGTESDRHIVSSSDTWILPTDYEWEEIESGFEAMYIAN